MRLGLDLLGSQSPSSRDRGIGRYTLEFTRALAATRGQHELVLYAHAGLPVDPELLAIPGVPLRWLERDRDRGQFTTGHVADELVRRNPDQLDALIVPSPFETWEGYHLPARRVHGPLMAAVLHDLIPLKEQPTYNTSVHFREYTHRLERLARYDRMLTNSEWSRREGLAALGLPEQRIQTVGTSTREGGFWPARGPATDAERRELAALGISGPFIFCVGGDDARKNLRGLVEAFAELPQGFRATHQLVISCRLSPASLETLQARAAWLGVGQHLVLTGGISDDTLRLLYQRCDLFAFPSLAEGFGLPVLEAMHCAAPVVASDRTSLPEVVGDAGVLADAADPEVFARAMAGILGDPSRAADYRRRALERAGVFSWRATAQRAWKILEDALRVTRYPRAARATRPRIAMVGPFPPAPSGVASYTTRLVEALLPTHEIHLFHDPAHIPDPSWRNLGVALRDSRLLSHLLAAHHYEAIHYHVGNSTLHRFAIDLLHQLPGVVTLHDVSLAGYYLELGRQLGVGRDLVGHMLALEGIHTHQWLGHAAQDDDAMLEGLQTVSDVNKAVLESARMVIVHSEASRQRIAERHFRLSSKVEVIPHGASVVLVDGERRRQARARLGLAEDCLLIVVPGRVHSEKYPIELLRAYAGLAERHPQTHLAYVGPELDGGVLGRAAAAQADLARRITVTGDVPESVYLDWLASADVGVCLRKPPTRGETSGAMLDLMRHGIPAIAMRTGWFGELPSEAVVMLDPDGREVEALGCALERLIQSPATREALGRAARRSIERRCSWAAVAERHAAVYASMPVRRRVLARPVADGDVSMATGAGRATLRRGRIAR
jgi:glycosyltransferase involved in cell wall biosynthesis